MKKLLIVIALLLFNLNIVFALEEGLSVNILPSGQKVIIKEVKDNPIVQIDTWINTGSINESDKTSGISHFLEHLFFKGTEKYPTGQMDKILDSKGAITNAGTSKDFTHYYIQIPSKDFDLALELHADMLQNPLIPRKELERERPVVIEEISKTKDSPARRAFDNLYELLYSKSNHPYKRSVIGTKEIIENVTREELLDYFNKFYTPDAYTTVIVGDVNKEEALKKVSQAFKQTKKKQTKIKYPNIKPLNKIETKEETMDVNKSYLMYGFLTPKFDENKDNYALDVLSTLLTDGKSSILNQKLKEEAQLALSINSSNYAQKDTGIFYFYLTLKPENESALKELLISELEKIKKGEFDKNLIAKAKNQIKTDTYYARESISNISEDLGYDFTFSKNPNYYENYLKNIEKVTEKDIIDVAKKYLTLDKYALSIIRPLAFKPVSNIEKKENWGAVKVLDKNENTKKFLLNNGATLTTKAKKTNSIIALNITIKGSKAVEKVPTSAMLAANSATTGTKNFTNSQLATYLDENGIKLLVTSEDDSFSITMQSTKDNLKKAFVVLDEVINHPTFADFEINKIKERKIQELKALSDSPSSYVFDEFKRLAFCDSIYGQNSSFILNHINKVTREDIFEFYSRIINPENMHIAIVGDIDENYAINELEKIIKKNPKGTKFDYKKQAYTKFEPTKNIESTLFKKEVQTNWIALGYKTTTIFNKKDIATLNVINSILGQGMSSRLFSKLREEQGLAYSVSSTLQNKIQDGAFIAYIGTNQKSIEQAKNGILEEIETIKKEMVTTKELNDAKDKILGRFLLSLETNMDEAILLSWYSSLNRNLNAIEEYKKLISEVSQSDIIEVANKYFSKPYIYTVVRENKQ
ncbi:MAG: insulinase family protein [Candidatus Gastranaerophilales bacterium]|nr:insulinase family protein [Candidatus Gastranaerophilales bacterium]